MTSASAAAAKAMPAQVARRSPTLAQNVVRPQFKSRTGAAPVAATAEPVQTGTGSWESF
ncbi:MAG: hypothetical protein ACREYA_12150 [Cupriavidus necator]